MCPAPGQKLPLFTSTTNDLAQFYFQSRLFSHDWRMVMLVLYVDDLTGDGRGKGAAVEDAVRATTPTLLLSD